MTLVEKQTHFSRMFAMLVLYAQTIGITVVMAEVMRTPEQQALYVQQGKSQTQNSKHLHKLAGDLLAFTDDGTYITTAGAYAPLGAFWRALDPLNVWGGDWASLVDAGHFEYSG